MLRPKSATLARKRESTSTFWIEEQGKIKSIPIQHSSRHRLGLTMAFKSPCTTGGLAACRKRQPWTTSSVLPRKPRSEFRADVSETNHYFYFPISYHHAQCLIIDVDSLILQQGVQTAEVHVLQFRKIIIITIEVRRKMSSTSSFAPLTSMINTGSQALSMTAPIMVTEIPKGLRRCKRDQKGELLQKKVLANIPRQVCRKDDRMRISLTKSSLEPE